MKKILLTYFAPFGEMNANSSEEVAKFINYENVDKIRLEVKYQKDFQLIKDKTFANNYDLILMLGQARGREAISLESRATNLNNPKAKDMDNFYPNEEIYANSSHYLYTKLDLESIINKVNENKVTISKNCGSYLCNFVYYCALKELNIPSLFIHLPSFLGQDDDKRIPKLEISEMVRIISKIISVISMEDAYD